MNKPEQNNRITLAGFLITLIGSVLFSVKAIIVKKAFGKTHTDALTLLTLRMFFSLPFYIFSAVIISNKKENIRISKKQWLYLTSLGMVRYYILSCLIL